MMETSAQNAHSVHRQHLLEFKGKREKVRVGEKDCCNTTTLVEMMQQSAQERRKDYDAFAAFTKLAAIGQGPGLGIGLALKKG